jgi:hypothetical protein
LILILIYPLIHLLHRFISIDIAIFFKVPTSFSVHMFQPSHSLMAIVTHSDLVGGIPTPLKNIS